MLREDQTPVEEKVCYKCKRSLPYGCFGSAPKAHTKLKLDGYCFECRAEYSRSDYQKHRPVRLQKAKDRDPAKSRASHRKRKYGISEADFAALLESQGGRCKICGQQGTEPYQLCVDHSHTTGKIRGLLCSGCNSGLGYFKDSPSLMRLAIAYLKEDGIGGCIQ